MKSSFAIGWLLVVGVLLLLLAIFFQTMTLAHGGYGSILITALALTMLADCCFIQAFRRGGLLVRCISVALLLPTVFVVADFARRAPYLF